MSRIPLAAVGAAPLGHLDEFGYIHFDDGSRVEWWVLGDDYWHVPFASPSLRQRSVDNTPLIETTIRVPGGDVSWRAAVVASSETRSIVVECQNRGTIPVALAIACVASDGEVSVDVVPVTHSNTYRRALDGGDVVVLDDVAKGWAALARQGARIFTEDPTTDDALQAARAALLLHAGGLISEGKSANKQVCAAVASALTLLDYEDEAGALRRATRLKPLRKGLPVVETGTVASLTATPLESLADALTAAQTVIAVRNSIVDDTKKAIDVLPAFEDSWRGRSIEVSDLPTNFGPLSFAVRWHGDKPALLWDAPAPLSAKAVSASWATAKAAGEELVV